MQKILGIAGGNPTSNRQPVLVLPDRHSGWLYFHPADEMNHATVRISPTFTGNIAAAIERAIRTAGLKITLRTSHRSKPGSMHWHCKRGLERGTLEITFRPDAFAIELVVRNGREGAWTHADLLKLKRLIGAGVTPSKRIKRRKERRILPRAR